MANGRRMNRKRDVAVVRKTSVRTRFLNRGRANSQGGIRL